METKALTWIVLFTLLSVSAYAQGSAIAQGGNITPLNIAVFNETQRWQGFAGTINFVGPDAPSSVLAIGSEVNGTTFNVTSACLIPTSVSGFILFSNSSVAPAGLVAGNLTVLDEFVAGVTDSGTRTFTSNSTFTILGSTISDVPTTNTFVNSGAQSTVFREGYFNDASGNLVFAVEVDLDSTGYNGSSFDFQALLPVDNLTDTTFFTSLNLNIVCPDDGAFGGGGRGGGYGQCIWSCGGWGPCGIDGRQNRTCRPSSNCGRAAGYPSLTRICASAPRGAVELDEQDIIRELQDLNVLLEAPTDVDALAGELLDIPVTVTNPRDSSIEQLTIGLRMPTLQRVMRPLHTNPLLYWFGTKPLAPYTTPAIWSVVDHTYTLPPAHFVAPTLQTNVPLIAPQTIQGTIEVYSGNVLLASQPINIKVDVPILGLMHFKKEHTSDVEILVDNRDRELRRIPLELSFNRGRSSLFTDYYTPLVPAGSVVIFGHTFSHSYDYESARVSSEFRFVEVS